MGNIASGHFKPTNNIQEKHNDRTLSPSYLLPEEFRGQNEVNRTSDQAIELKERIIESAKETYSIAFKQKFQAKSYQWSLVVNIKTNTTMSDLEKLADHFDLKYGFQCYQIAIHRDEGYIDENNQPHTNHHAHMEFVTLNKENGKNMMGQISPVKLGQLQTEIAQILGMERGKSGAKRIEPRKYAQMKEKERKALNTLKQEKDKEIAILENKLQEQDKIINELQERPTTEQYSQLDKANSEQAQTIQEKDKEIATLNTLNAKLEKTNKDLQRPSLWDIINEKYIDSTKNKREIETKDKEIDTLKQEKTTLESKLQEKDKTINELNQFKNSSNLALDLEKAQERIKTLESNENALKNDLNAKETTINELKKQIQDLEYNYTQERERMKAENKRLQEQGLDKIYTQKDYKALKKQHADEIEALKNKIQEQDKTIKKNNTYKRQAQNARNKQTQQKRTMKTKQTTTPTPSPTPQPTYTYSKRM